MQFLVNIKKKWSCEPQWLRLTINPKAFELGLKLKYMHESYDQPINEDEEVS